MIQLFKGDCLIESDKIESGSVDLILTDLPYGIIQGFGKGIKTHNLLSQCDWDIAIEPKKIYKIANRILRKNGKMILFSQEPYTNRLITEALPNLAFSYKMIWEKNNYANFLLCNKAPVSFFEDILLFCKKDDPEDGNPVRIYFKNERKKIDHLNYPQIGRILGVTRQEVNNWLSVDKANWNFPTEKNYNKLKLLGICEIDYLELKKIHEDFLNTKPAIFNLLDESKFKSNILKYKKEGDRYHPTQKPVLLLEDLIKTFSNENDLVVDLTMGSGSTGVACKNTNRSFIGIEKDDSYFKIAEQRINTRTLFS